LIIAETSWLMKAEHPIEIAENSRCRRHTVLIYSDYLRSALNISFSRFQQTSGMNHAFPDGRKSFSTLAIPTQLFSTSGLVFQPFRIGKSGATISFRRSGAQRGAHEDKLRPEVFLDAPCIFPSTHSALSSGRRQPSPDCRSAVELACPETQPQ
jgi:hypothetical protein